MKLAFLKSVFAEVLSFGTQLFIQKPKCVSLNNWPYLARPTLIDINPDELCYYLFVINLGRCSESCNTPVNSSALIFDLSNSLCVPKKTEIVNVKLFMWNFKWQHRDSNPQTLSS